MPFPTKIEDYRAPWETEAGEDTEIDKDRLKKYLFGVLTDKEKASAKTTELTTKVAELQKQLDAKPSGDEDVEALKKELADTKDALAKAPKPSDVTKLEVALDKGLTAVQAKRLLGDTKEELEKDAEELLESFGGRGSVDDEDGEGEGARRQPRVIRTGGDPDPSAGRELDPLKAIEDIPRINS